MTGDVKSHFSSPITAASSTGQCNTIERIDSAMLPWENYLFNRTHSKPSQGSVPAGLTLASDFSFCFPCQVGSSFVLRRPIETTALITHLPTTASDVARTKKLHAVEGILFSMGSGSRSLH
jgi:hypothetical protein